MRTQIRSALVAGAATVLLVSGSGAASAQGSLSVALPFPLDIPALASLFGGPVAPGVDPGALTPTESDEAVVTAPAVAAPGDGADPAAALGVPLPPEVGQMAFEGTVVAGLNEARTAMGHERLITDPRLSDDARDAATRAAADPDVDPVAEAAGVETLTRVVLDLDEGTSPQTAIAALLADPWSRDQVFNRENVRVGAGSATSDDGRVHLVIDFDRA